jgi:DUF971 family protein
MPPGTGDVQITLTQSASFTGAVIVTTAHQLSIQDVSKGVEMFKQVKVPVVSVVKNMAHFKCKVGNVYYPFGKLENDAMIETLFNSDTATSSSARLFPVQELPFFMSQDGVVSDEHLKELDVIYADLSKKLTTEIFKIFVDAKLIPSLRFIEGRGIVLRYFGTNSASEYVVSPESLRKRDPRTGVVRKDDTSRFHRIIGNSLNTSKIPVPTHFEIRGNYGVSITWSDGFDADIYPFEILKKIALEQISTEENEK